ncbi:hypothetical protein EYC98_10545 [Halieaceae bacterium IMCC14734]|uniref:Mutator family transposase n=1 Tax=Candidatus Litorirhabdus singularis TaxID=2518993 RepID=A0ABT3TIX4_9GAMM|nr:hypothetical protein [Candidatus Litorirhabdus singularis]
MAAAHLEKYQSKDREFYFDYESTPPGPIVRSREEVLKKLVKTILAVILKCQTPNNKHQRRFTAMDDKILFLYNQGMTTGQIVITFKEMYGADVSAAPISKVTDAVIEQVVEWQS